MRDDVTETTEAEAPRKRGLAAQALAQPVQEPPAVPLLGVPLEGVFLAWVKDRAAAHGEEPGPHVARILRQYWAQHDTWRHENAEGGTALARGRS